MPRDPRVTAYIRKAAPFARPILTHLRDVVHTACPKVEERMKWSFPHFDYNGKMMCSMAAFKEHSVFGFWYAKHMMDPQKVMEKTGANTAMGNFGRIRKISDLPKKSVLVAYIKEAAVLNESGRSSPSTKTRAVASKKVAVPRTPSVFLARIRKDKKAFTTFTSFPPGQKKDYVEWVREAKTEETRERRIKTALEWMAEGKPRNWKYMKKW